MDKTKLTELVQRKLFLDDEVDALEQRVSDLKSERYILTTRTIPTLLTDDGLRSATTDDGVKIDVIDDVQGNIPKDPERSAEALAWLRSNGYGG